MAGAGLLPTKRRLAMNNIYADIARRTGGNIYIGVVGPVRTGKSTLIKRLMEKLVIPNISDPNRAQRARDELPQSGSGKTIMTSEPKFIPEEAVEIQPDGSTKLRIRLIDSVGYMVEGAAGATEDGAPRMVSTPWSDQPIPLTEAAELGTRKVMEDHASIGIVVTTDGTITDIPRADYMQAERKAIEDIQATGKPFLTIINTTNPVGQEALELRDYLKDTFGIDAAIADCLALDSEGITALLQDLMYNFPMAQISVNLPAWVRALEDGHPIKQALYPALLECAGKIGTLGQAEKALAPLSQLDAVESVRLDGMDLGTGTVRCCLLFPQSLYYQILSEKTGCQIHTEGDLMNLLTELSQIRQEYSKISDALAAAKATGYGIVMPTADEMKLETPEVLKKGSSFGVKLKAGAPSIHMIRVDIDTEISPMVGDEKQSRELIDYLTAQDLEKLWQSNIFGKSVYELIRDGLTAKLIGTPEDVRGKFRSSLSRIVNEGATGLICLIL